MWLAPLIFLLGLTIGAAAAHFLCMDRLRFLYRHRWCIRIDSEDVTMLPFEEYKQLRREAADNTKRFKKINIDWENKNEHLH